MTAKCSVCLSTVRESVDVALVAGKSIRAIAAEFGLNRNAVHGHSKHASASESGDQGRPEVQALLRTSRRLLTRCEKAGDLASALRALDRIVELEKLAVVEPIAAPTGPVEIRVSYDTEGHDSCTLTPEARQHYLAQLLINELTDEATPEPVLAAAARVASYLQRKELPAEVAAEVERILEAEKEEQRGAS